MRAEAYDRELHLDYHPLPYNYMYLNIFSGTVDRPGTELYIMLLVADYSPATIYKEVY